jgi:hypothetical protein
MAVYERSHQATRNEIKADETPDGPMNISFANQACDENEPGFRRSD